MKKISLLLIVVLSFLTTQAQENPVKDTYVKKGDLVEATLYYENGVIRQKGFYTNEGVTTGNWVSYDRNGIKTAEAKYKNGTKVGTWFFWKEDTLTEVDYNNSEIVAVNTWKNKDTQVVSND